MVALPTVSLGGIGAGLILWALLLHGGMDKNSSLNWHAANKMLLKLGSDGINMV